MKKPPTLDESIGGTTARGRLLYLINNTIIRAENQEPRTLSPFEVCEKDG